MVEPLYECIPEGKAWIVVNIRTSKPAEIDGAPLVGLSFDDADEIARLLNGAGKILAEMAASLATSAEDPPRA